MKNRIIVFSVCLISLIGCKEPFMPGVTTTNSNLLVVEGFINLTDSTYIKLSRTVVVGNKNTTINPEVLATVTVESDANDSYLLKEEKPGLYNTPALNLNAAKKYRIKIKTAKGNTYTSDFVVAKVSPSIDKIGFTAKDSGLQIHASTHDATNKSTYYRYEYEDAWIFYSKRNSLLIYDPKSGVRSRQQTSENITKCWGTANSTTIVLGSTAKLSQDVLFESPILFISSSSEKLSEKYSILVKQYAITKDAYDFWEKLRKNTEALGSIFDAQPSELTGNVHNIADAGEPVFGFIGAGTVIKQRIFITKSQLPNHWKVEYPYSCVSLDIIDRVGVGFDKGQAVLIDTAPMGGYYISTKECADCTIRGKNTAPSFWQ